MISLNDSNLIIAFVLKLFAFVFSITFAGTLQAKISRWMGDDTADELGFGDFNPLVHVQFLDSIFFIIFEIMLGRPIPVNGSNLPQKNRLGRFFIIFGSRAAFHIVLSLIAIFGRAFIISFMINSQQNNSFMLLLQNFADVLAQINALLAGFCIIRESVYGFVAYHYAKNTRFIEYANPILIFGVLLILILFGGLILNATNQLIILLAQKMMRLFIF